MAAIEKQSPVQLSQSWGVAFSDYAVGGKQVDGKNAHAAKGVLQHLARFFNYVEMAAFGKVCHFRIGFPACGVLGKLVF